MSRGQKVKFTKEITKLEHSAAKLTVTVAKEDVANGYKTTLGKYVKQCRFISGATILGDGEIALILDANALI